MKIIATDNTTRDTYTLTNPRRDHEAWVSPYVSPGRWDSMGADGTFPDGSYTFEPVSDRFKPGDKVTIQETHVSAIPVGSVQTLGRMALYTNDGPYWVIGGYHFREENLEPAHRFAVGDRVRRIATGTPGTIVKIDDSGSWPYWVDSHEHTRPYPHGADEIEPLPEQPVAIHRSTGMRYLLHDPEHVKGGVRAEYTPAHEGRRWPAWTFPDVAYEFEGLPVEPERMTMTINGETTTWERVA